MIDKIDEKELEMLSGGYQEVEPLSTGAFCLTGGIVVGGTISIIIC